jgi:hypothetical protein
VGIQEINTNAMFYEAMAHRPVLTVCELTLISHNNPARGTHPSFAQSTYKDL